LTILTNDKWYFLFISNKDLMAIVSLASYKSAGMIKYEVIFLN